MTNKEWLDNLSYSEFANWARNEFSLTNTDCQDLIKWLKEEHPTWRNDVVTDWRNDPVTDKQKRLIAEMNEFSEFPLPPFTGKTKGEASDYISANLSKSHEKFDLYEDNYGNQD